MKTKYFIEKNYYDFDPVNGIYSKLLNRFLKGTDDGHGYLRVTLKCTDGLQHSFMYHKVLWEHFNGEVPDGYEINHKDENKHNFKISNLELLTHKDNINYGTRNSRTSAKMKGKKMPQNVLDKIREVTSKKVYQYTKDGVLICIFPSAHEASRQTNFSRGNITACCLGLRKTTNGYKWSYIPQ